MNRELDAKLRQLVQMGGLVERDAAGNPVGLRVPLGGDGFQVIRWEDGELVVVMCDGTGTPFTLCGDEALRWAVQTLEALRNVLAAARSEGREPEPDPRLN